MASTTDPEASPKKLESVFRRGESVLAHSVYGVILTMATLGELIHQEVSAGTAVAWLIGAGAVLLVAHLFSDLLAHVAATRDDADWSEIVHIGRHDLSVTAGAIGAALIMTIAALADLDSQSALVTCVVIGLIALGTLSLYATAGHRWWTQLAMSASAVGLGAVIVVMENTV